MTGPRAEAFEIMNADATGPAVIVCEHASNHIPERYDGLGLTCAARDSHVAWDPGAEGVAQGLAAALDAPMIAGRISRLVYDCNRPPEAPSAIPVRSAGVEVPGNAGLSEAARAARAADVYDPFSHALDDLLARRGRVGTPFALITVHSFTPVWQGVPRAVEIGILHDADTRLADAILAEEPRGRVTLRNAPYGPEDGVTHTLRRHGLGNALPNVMIEIRNDLIATPAEQARITRGLASMLGSALSCIGVTGAQDA
jgi:predicted N-formylglutamate amidohydrolase